MSQKDHNKANSGTGDKLIQKDVRSWRMLWKALGSSVEVPKAIDISSSSLSPAGRLERMTTWISPLSSSREAEEVRPTARSGSRGEGFLLGVLRDGGGVGQRWGRHWMDLGF
jgi:hypothetical protein